MIRLTLVIEENKGMVVPHLDFTRKAEATLLEIEALRALRIHDLPDIVGAMTKRFLDQGAAKES